MRLVGECRAKIDSKGRMRIPSSLLEQLEHFGSTKFVLSRGTAKCINLYPEKVWDNMLDKLEEKLDEFDPHHERILRAYYGGSKRMEPDSSTRVTVPSFLLEYAEIKGDVVFMGMSTKIEIWSADIHNKENMLSPEEFTAISKQASEQMREKNEE